MLAYFFFSSYIIIIISEKIIPKGKKGNHFQILFPGRNLPQVSTPLFLPF